MKVKYLLKRNLINKLKKQMNATYNTKVYVTTSLKSTLTFPT